MQGEQIRKRLHSGERVYGMAIALSDDGRALQALAQAESDFVLFCAEHHPLDRAKSSMLCHFYRLNKVSPIVRITRPCPYEAAMALDGGAQGIVAPYVETVEQARELVGAVHYRPLKGKLLAGLLSGAQMPNEKTSRYLKEFNRHNYVIIGVESVPAYENLDKLLAVDGVDAVFIGPHDLSVSIGVPEEWTHPEFIRVIEDVITRCRAVGKGVGVHLFGHIFPHKTICRLMDKGMNLILYSSDLIVGRDALRTELGRLQGHVEETDDS